MIPSSWKPALQSEEQRIAGLLAFVETERAAGKTIYPPEADLFSALRATPLEDVKVVILGQDPYHRPGQAHGMCFSVRRGVKIPASLRNIYKELVSDLGVPTPMHGNLEDWAQQGVLLLNTVLTVEEGKAGSHSRKGWEQVTDAIIQAVNDGPNKVAFVLWGAPAQKRAARVDGTRHFVLKTAHPSPLAATRCGFFGTKPFSQVNNWLAANGKTPIDWRIS